MTYSRPVFDFSGKSVLVTGGTSGIGAAIAEAFATSGAQVMLTGRNEERGKAVKERIHTVKGIAEFIAGDITDNDYCAAVVQQTVGRFGGLDILVNSAGTIHHATADETTDTQWRETMQVNVDAVFYTCRAAVPVLRERGGGVIINIASDAGLSGSQHLVAYCASKGAVILMTRAMALDHAAEGIRIVALCPGDVDTPMLRGEFVQRGVDAEVGLRGSAEATPLGRVATPEEVADLALYVASDSARFMTGAAVALDGGSRA
ncbi:MAG: SDR family oxidoreductase [Gammaproteobacteria bacterium]|nr:SDR family oxidoreductase [Gammaproteobacteria bacterium]